METSRNNYIKFQDLDVYKLSREMSDLAWNIYDKMDIQTRIQIGSQFIRSVDSVGANIAEGYGRYHFLDKIKFYYNSRGSLLESEHWIELLNERKLIGEEVFKKLGSLSKNLEIKLNNLISSTYKSKENKTDS